MEEVQNENEINYKFGKDIKIIIVGNLSTGKTSIINRYMNDNFEEHCRATIAPEFSFKKLIFVFNFGIFLGKNVFQL